MRSEGGRGWDPNPARQSPYKEKARESRTEKGRGDRGAGPVEATPAPPAPGSQPPERSPRTPVPLSGGVCDAAWLMDASPFLPIAGSPPAPRCQSTKETPKAKAVSGTRTRRPFASLTQDAPAGGVFEAHRPSVFKVTCKALLTEKVLFTRGVRTRNLTNVVSTYCSPSH